MPAVLIYLLKCQISLAIVWLFYQLLLRKLTFYTMNRWYLLGYACLSFLLPLIHIVLPGEGMDADKVKVIHYIPALIRPEVLHTGSTVFTLWNITLTVLAAGTLVLAVRLAMRWMSLHQIRRGAKLVRQSVVQIYQVDMPIIPFSFGNAIYLNSRLHTEKEYEQIILHEYVHVRQRHTVDIMLAELLCIISWYNPFSWLIRHSIRQNLEFIADQQVLASGLDRKSYQYHLLKVVGEPVYRLANNFNFSSLKKRIIMMNKSRSARLHLVKFLFIIPLLGVLLVAFRDKVNIHLSTSVNKGIGMDVQGISGDTTPSPVRIGLHDGAIPMYVINETEATAKAQKGLKPDDIESINVLKKAPEFGPGGANGVILIYLKNYKITGTVTLKDGTKIKLDNRTGVEAPPQKTTSVGDDARDGTGNPVGVTVFDTVNTGALNKVNVQLGQTEPVKIRARDANVPDNPLYLLDGKEISAEEANKLEPGRIATVQVIKNEAAKAIYGTRAANGVIMIATKQPGFKGQVSIISVTSGDTIRAYADTIKIMPTSK